jgi:antitoxin protein of toxin-antitoxin system
MGFGDELRDLGKKAKDLAQDHPDQADKAIDKLGDELGQRTGGKFDGQIDSAERKADEFLGIGDRERDGQNRVTGREHPGGRQDQPGDRKP